MQGCWDRRPEGSQLPPQHSGSAAHLYIRIKLIKLNTVVWKNESSILSYSCNEQVVGSNPTGGSSSGKVAQWQLQWTVNPPSQSSMVRVHLFPQCKQMLKKKKNSLGCCLYQNFVVYLQSNSKTNKFIDIMNATYTLGWWNWQTRGTYKK